MIKKLLVADIGGSKTRIQLLTANGELISEFIGIGVATAVDDEAPLPELEELLEEIPDKPLIAAAAINLGGCNTGQVLKVFRLFLPDIPIKIFRESEGTAAYALCGLYNASIALMVGTGSIAVGRSKNGYVTTGGWGCNIGDGGSGYDIGLEAIRISLSALDKTETLSALARAVCSAEEPFSATDTPAEYRDKRDMVRKRLYPLDRQHIASFSKVVAKLAEQGDEDAIKIFKTAGERLAELVIMTAKKLDEQEPCVVVTGGLVKAKELWASSFEGLLSGSKICYVEDGLLVGTRCIAKELLKTGD